MGWISTIFGVVLLCCISTSCENLNEPEINSESFAELQNSESSADFQNEDDQLKELGKYLAYVLVNPWPKSGLPLLYVEEYPDYSDDNENMENVIGGLGEDVDAEGVRQVPFKRSRYYRKYPWKRQNSRQTYEAENRYLCQPSKDDVFRLLVALHEARQGNRGRTINFCNRKRPASAIFTNIRFLGKR